MIRLCILLLLLTHLARAEQTDHSEKSFFDNFTKATSTLPFMDQEDPEDLENAAALLMSIRLKDSLERQATKQPMILLPHKPNYIMPFSYTEAPYDDLQRQFAGDQWTGFKNIEAMFQISIKYQVYQLDDANDYKLYVAYTNKSYWQVYNENASRPFRETNHEPELFLQMSPEWGPINHVRVGLNHQSNGQYLGFSRSWNRITSGFYHLSGNSIFGIEPWYRIKEQSSGIADDPTDDDNPDIEKYLGYANFIWHKQNKRTSRSIRFGNNLRGGSQNRGWVELEVNFPLGRRFKGFVQYFEGFGHSLIEYDQYQRRLGFGIKITDYL
ncbi:MAG: phospholipase A1 [Crocinitomicaceae bacterium]|jgi:phospholipase A1